MHCSNRYESNRKEKLKLKKIHLATKRYYGAGVYFSEKKDRLIKYSCNCKKLRQSLNRKIRRRLNRVVGIDEAIFSNGHYRKMEDYWWTLL